MLDIRLMLHEEANLTKEKLVQNYLISVWIFHLGILRPGDYLLICHTCGWGNLVPSSCETPCYLSQTSGSCRSRRREDSTGSHEDYVHTEKATVANTWLEDCCRLRSRMLGTCLEVWAGRLPEDTWSSCFLIKLLVLEGDRNCTTLSVLANIIWVMHTLNADNWRHIRSQGLGCRFMMNFVEWNELIWNKMAQNCMKFSSKWILGRTVATPLQNTLLI